MALVPATEVFRLLNLQSAARSRCLAQRATAEAVNNAQPRQARRPVNQGHRGVLGGALGNGCASRSCARGRRADQRPRLSHCARRGKASGGERASIGARGVHSVRGRRWRRLGAQGARGAGLKTAKRLALCLGCARMAPQRVLCRLSRRKAPLRAMRHMYRHQGMCVSHADVARAQEPCMGSRGCWDFPQRFTCFCPRDAGPAAACCPPWAPYSNVACARCSMRARPPRGCCVGLPAPRALCPC